MRFATILFIALFMLILVPLLAPAADPGPPAVLARAALALASAQAPRPPQAPALLVSRPAKAPSAPRAGTQTCDCGGTANCVCSPGACACPSCTSLACAARRAERKAARQAGMSDSPTYDVPLASYESAVYAAPVRQTYCPVTYPSLPAALPTMSFYPAQGMRSACPGGRCSTGH